MLARSITLSLLSLALSGSAARAQLSIPWFSIDGGGSVSTGGTFALSGAIGQADAGPGGALAGGAFTLTGGFWVGGSTPSCPADFNRSGGVTVQDIFDYLAAYFAGGAAADFNGSGAVTVQDIFDFLGAYFVAC